jgi:biopolymer transport protein ExbD
MAFNLASEDDDDELLGAINTTPLVDVMLVLLIIFLITIPVVTHTIPVTLPRQVNQPTQASPQSITLAVTAGGDVYWNADKLAGDDDLHAHLTAIAAQSPQPDLLIRGDQNAHYKSISAILRACQKAGISHVEFIMQPPAPAP